ncbi:MAG: chromosome segregation protein SMC, partial [Rhodothermales bacterium]
RYKDASARLHELELALAHVEYSRLSERREHINEELAVLERESEATSEQESTAETSLESLRRELNAGEEQLEVRRGELSSHLEKVRELETERRLAEERLESARNEIRRAHQEQETADERRATLEEEIASLESDLREAEPALEKAVEKLEQVRQERDARQAAARKKQQALQELRRKERDFENKRAEQRRRLDRMVNRRELVDEDIARTQSQLQELEESLDALRNRVTEADESRNRAESEVADARAALEQAAQERAFKQEQLDDAIENVRQLERKRDALGAEVQLLESMLSSYDDLSDAVQYLADSNWSDKDLTTVADILACDEADRIALDAALGSYASCIIVDSAEEAQRAVRMLRDEEQGRATFILLDRLTDLPPDARSSIDATPLRKLVRTASATYDTLADLLLRDTYLVDTLERAEALSERASGTARFFARTGEWIDAQGFIHGGSRQEGTSPAAGRLGRREQLEQTRLRLAELDRKLEQAEAEAEHFRHEFEAVPHESCRSELATAEKTLNEAEKRAARVSFELKSADERRAELVDKMDRSTTSRAEASEEAEQLEIAVKEAGAALSSLQSRVAEAEAAFEAAETESKEAAAAFNEANITAIEARNRRDNYQRDLERARRQIEEILERAEERALRIRELEGTIERTHDRVDEVSSAYDRIAGRQESLNEGVSSAEKEVHRVREAINDVEGELRGLRRQREHLMREENQRAVRLAEIQTRSADLVEHISEEFSIPLPDAFDDGRISVPDDFEETSARADVADLRRNIRSLGGVNELALEAYEEEKERLDFLLQQQEDLERAEEKLMETIDEINTTASKRFLETYEKIRANFQRIFVDLFGVEAAADLELEDPEDPLETAIEIMARPRGKRPSTISQLSGGEKTLTAIALLFGIYLVKPSPFCILDEVDAPLDDANVERFMRLIRQFSANTQFILVTHNKLTMEAADRLYGITMQEQGVSRLVGVKFDEAIEMTEQPAPREAA